MFIKTIVFLLTFYLASATSNHERPGWPGYTYYPEIQGWLKLHTDPDDWQTARMNCHDEDAILAALMPGSINKLNSIIMTMSLGGDDDVNIFGDIDSDSTSPAPRPPMAIYVGVQMIYPEGVYEIKNGKSVLTLDSADIKNLNNCAAFDAGKMVWVNCNQRLYYVCHAPASIPELNECGDNNLGYELDARTGQCYKFHSQAVPWNTAHRTCLDEGAYLAIPNSDLEAQVLVDLFDKYPYEKLNGTNPAWGVMAIGFYYWKQADKYVTIFGQTIEEAGYATWSAGNPSSRGKSKELGGGMFRYGQLDDVDKSYAVPFICEKASVKK